MTELYFVDGARTQKKLNELLYARLGENFKISKNQNGKPYIEGNPVYFSVSHSGGKGVVAIGDGPVGVDLEIFKKRERPSVLNRFSPRERERIFCEEDFLKHWTAREAYTKLYGLDIAKTWKRIEFFDGSIYFDGAKTDVVCSFYRLYFGVVFVAEEMR